MRFRRFALAFVSLTADAPTRHAIVTSGAWAAFCDEPRRCYAIARPDGGDRRGFLMVSFGRSEVSAAFGQPVRAAILAVAGRRIVLQADGSAAHAPARASRRILAAIRTADTLSIVATAATGRRLRQYYTLAGAPTAIDAAAVAALR